MKIKILTSIIITAISVVAIMSTASKGENIKQTKEETLSKYERVATKLTQKPPSVSESNQSTDSKASLKESEGHINKEYGIREDILRYIEKELPPNNEKAKKAAITYAQTDQLIYYKANQEEAIKAITKKLISLDCLRNALKNANDPAIPKHIDKLMRNTKERDEHMWNVDKKYFGWKIMGYGDITDEQINKMCENGNY